MAWHKNREQAPKQKQDEIFSGWFKKTHYQNTLLLHQAAEIAQLLSENKIPYVFVKGVPLLLRVYPTCGTRPTSDMDVLIPEHFRYKALEVMSRAGFTHNLGSQMGKYIRLNGNKGVELSKPKRKGVDLHWKSMHWQYPKEFEETYFKNKSSIVRRDQEFFTASTEDLFFHTMANHGIFNTGKVLPWILDIWLLDRKYRIDPKAILARAEATDTTGILRNQLRLVEEILPEFNQEYLRHFNLVPKKDLQEEKNAAMQKAHLKCILLYNAITMERAHVPLLSPKNFPYYLNFFSKKIIFNCKHYPNYLKTLSLRYGVD